MDGKFLLVVGNVKNVTLTPIYGLILLMVQCYVVVNSLMVLVEMTML